MEKESVHFLPLAAQAKAKLPEHSPGSKQLLNFWIFQIAYCRKVCSENLMEKPLPTTMALPDIGLASFVSVLHSLVATSRCFCPVKPAFWTNMCQVVRGRKASVVTNSVYSLILRWISDECCCCCCCLEIAGWESTWNVSTVPDQAAVFWLLPLFCAFFLFSYIYKHPQP